MKNSQNFFRNAIHLFWISFTTLLGIILSIYFDSYIILGVHLFFLVISLTAFFYFLAKQSKHLFHHLQGKNIDSTTKEKEIAAKALFPFTIMDSNFTWQTVEVRQSHQPKPTIYSQISSNQS